MAFLLAAIAGVLEVIHWAITRDSSLGFYALVLLTAAVLWLTFGTVRGRFGGPAA